jgi:hypothetical protein
MSINVDHLGRIHFAETFIAVIQHSYNLQMRAASHQNLLHRESGVSISTGALEGVMSQIVAHYPQLGKQSLTDKPIVEFFAAQRLQHLWHRSKVRSLVSFMVAWIN